MADNNSPIGDGMRDESLDPDVASPRHRFLKVVFISMMLGVVGIFTVVPQPLGPMWIGAVYFLTVFSFVLGVYIIISIVFNRTKTKLVVTPPPLITLEEEQKASRYLLIKLVGNYYLVVIAAPLLIAMLLDYADRGLPAETIGHSTYFIFLGGLKLGLLAISVYLLAAKYYAYKSGTFLLFDGGSYAKRYLLVCKETGVRKFAVFAVFVCIVPVRLAYGWLGIAGPYLFLSTYVF